MKRLSSMAKCSRPTWMLLLLLGVIKLSACEAGRLAQPVGGLHLQRQDRESRGEPPPPGEHEDPFRVLLEEQRAAQQQQRAAQHQQRAAQQQMLEDVPRVLLVSGEAALSELVTHSTSAAAGKKLAAAGLPPVAGGGTQHYRSRSIRKKKQQQASQRRKGTRPSQHHIGPGLHALLRNPGEEKRKTRTFLSHDVISWRQMLLELSGGDERREEEEEEEAATAAHASKRQTGRPDALHKIAPKTVKTAEPLRFSLMGAESSRNPVAAAAGGVAKLLVFLLMKSLFGRHLCGTKAAALSSIATTGGAAYPLSAAVTASLLGAADFVIPASSSFVSATTSASSASASSAKSANERSVAKSADRQAAREHERTTAGGGDQDDSQQRQTLKPPTGEQQQMRAPALGGQQPQQQMRILTQLGQRLHVNRQRRQQQQRNRQKRGLHKDDSADEQPPLHAAARLATISLRQEQQQQQKQQAQDSDWSSRVRVSSRSLLAPASSFLAVPPASRLWQNGRGIKGEVAKEPEATGSSSDKEEKLLRSGSHSSSNDSKTASSLVMTHEHVQHNTGDRLIRTGEKLEGGGGDGGQQPRDNRGKVNTATQQQTGVPASSYLAVGGDEDQWREGIDNKRFPCIMRQRTTEGSVLKQVQGVRTEHKCQRLCRREQSCTHAVLNIAEDTCSLKAGVIDPIWGGDSEILIPYTCRDCWHPNAGFNQSPFLSRNFYSPYACTSFCLSQPQCVWWMYNTYNENCQLYSGVGDNDVQWDKKGWAAGRASWCALTGQEQKELDSPEEGEASLGSGWIKSQCMHPPHYKSTAKAFEQFANLTTADLCQKECQKRPLCRYFDFNRSDNTCRLIEKEGYKVEEANNYVAGPRTCNMSCMLFGRTLNKEAPPEAAPPPAEQPPPSMLAADDFWEVVAETAMECQVRCNEDTNCKRFSYCTETLKCMMSKIGPPRPSMTIKPGAIQEEEEIEENPDEIDLPENELSYRTTEASGCYVGPATFCVTKQ